MPKRKKKEEVPIVTEAFLLADGNVITKAQLDAYQVKIAKTKQLETEKEDVFDYKKVAEPPYNMAYLIKILQASTDHYRCVKAKATDIAGLGWDVIEREKKRDAEGRTIEKAEEKNREILEGFFDSCSDEMTFTDLMDRELVDLESIGCSYIEVGRNLKGRPAKLWHAPGHTIRVKRGRKGFIQIVEQKTCHFMNYGEKILVFGKNGLPKKTKFIDPKDGKKKQNLGMIESANELIQIRKYHPGSLYYGLPDFIPALGAITGNVSQRDYNISFFENNAVPQYAIIVKGGEMTEDVKTLIKQYFRSEIKGQAHKTLIMPIPSKDIEVTFERLSVDIKEQSFTVYRKDNRDEIIRAHGVQPSRVGIIEAASLGAGTGLSQLENYKRGIIEPLQSRIEFMLNQKIVRQGFGIYDWEFKFADIDIRDREMEMKIATEYLERGVYNINHVRKVFLHLKGVKGGDRNFIKVGTEIKFIDELGEAKEAGETEKMALKTIKDLREEIKKHANVSG